jgi:hypothetical protein
MPSDSSGTPQRVKKPARTPAATSNIEKNEPERPFWESSLHVLAAYGVFGLVLFLTVMGDRGLRWLVKNDWLEKDSTSYLFLYWGKAALLAIDILALLALTVLLAWKMLTRMRNVG